VRVGEAGERVVLGGQGRGEVEKTPGLIAAGSAAAGRGPGLQGGCRPRAHC